MQTEPPEPATRRTPGLGLYSIVYISTAVRTVGPGDLAHLLDGARRRNAEERITGVLLYSDGSFMQYLEGPAAGLARVYDLIKAHPLHYGLIDLVREPVRAREFAEWSMAFHLVGAMGQADPAEQDALLARKLDNAANPASAACELLSAFWLKGRASVSSALLRRSAERARYRPAVDLDMGTHD